MIRRMNHRFLEACFLRRSVAAVALMGALASARAGWTLTWSDEFNGDSIDTNHWTFERGNGANGWGNRELEYYTARPENAFVRDGLLHIQARQEPLEKFKYTSARMKTHGLFSQRYGRFEFRAKLPSGKGYWPALWLLPAKPVYGGWAASGEIDVMEAKGDDPGTVLGTIHYGGRWPHNTHSNGPEYHFPAGQSAASDFHLYAVDWTTNAIKWSVDGHVYETQTHWWSASNPADLSQRNPFPAPFDQPFYIIMNLAVGGDFDGDPDAGTAFPGEMVVDYVRVYQETGGSAAR